LIRIPFSSFAVLPEPAARWLACACLQGGYVLGGVLLSAAAMAQQAPNTLDTPDDRQTVALGVTGANNSDNTPDSTSSEQLGGLSDTQLTSLAADWSVLDDNERTQLIQETRERMQPDAASLRRPTATKSRANNRQPGTQTGTLERRRYGRLVRKPDGSVVRSVVEIETRVVRVGSGDPQRAFGMGFERRRRGRPGPQGAPNINPTPRASSPNAVISVSDTADSNPAQ